MSKLSGQDGPIDGPILPTQCRGKCREERDEARRLYCVMAANVMYKSNERVTAEHVANCKNWDCYFQDTKGIPDAKS